LQLTAWLEYLLEARCGAALQQVTSANPGERGAQLSVRVRGGSDRARAVFDALLPLKLIADWREPDIIRIAPVPLYNSYDDVWRAVGVLQQVLINPP
jgi:kynureninase